ncbi:hypothetical protein UREG_02325 [Uncinocarpus reesii 1704]|uniref:DNA-repair protein rad13 n=1 Tax=Uncinocarpus reesii (strain UAMH 1704) TaxID=336963 RepID=C4JFA3_UNCRE|nr:uncharacterized protein UREG_02325 [Uncinocarpus reesii 1704]EEP77476.1 hypothetical protein UREG_02325 [Uncinocarpus reesii 1704]
MGVTGLWTVLKPCARPIKLETLNKKRLAVDASIWIYQFLKAVRDKEGNALRNAHIVGFFRRICKLLYFGIKPVFVFDGGAPTLKRQTIASRKKRREGRREDATKTASKLLAVQLQKLAEEEEMRRKEQSARVDEQQPLPENLVYAEEVFMTPKERRQNRQFRKKDAYHLPELDVSLEEMGAPNDPRIMSHEELEEYARQFHSGENINLYDFSSIDFDSPFFLSLPASDRYNILNAARIRSRLRMGYSKDQLDTMFQDRMAFSRFQIERVKERNDLTQRLMHINGMNGDDPIYGSSSRIAGEKNKEYVLVKDNNVEGGWALGVFGNRDGEHQNKPIDLESDDNQLDNHEESEDEDIEFEDVPISGLSQLPDLPIFEQGVFDQSIPQHVLQVSQERRDLYDSRRQAAGLVRERPIDTEAADNDELFVSGQMAPSTGGYDPLFEDNDDENLRRAIQLSLEKPNDSDNEEDMARFPFPDGQSNLLNPAADASARDSTKQVLETEDNGVDLFAAIAKSQPIHPSSTVQSSARQFNGPLPFKPFKVTKITKSGTARIDSVGEAAGGFERTENNEPIKSKPLPPWFSGNKQRQEFIEQEPDGEYSGESRYQQTTQYSDISANSKPVEVIDLVEDGSPKSPNVEIESRFPPTVQRSLRSESEVFDDKQHKEPSRSPAKSNIGLLFESAGSAAVVSDAIKNDASMESPVLEQTVKEKSPTAEFEDVDISRVIGAGVNPSSHPVIPLELAEDTTQELFEEVQFSDPEEAELIHQLAAETEEYARFASTLNFKSQAENADAFDRELKQLRAQQKKDRRDADEVSHIMVTECQQLLKLFGLPYITAPMEAEAQCAELVSLGLVDGIVTDDSDTFLFGGTRVYKNMFNQAKFVECYLVSDLEKEYSLDRKKLISFAHLLGSDYTEGIPGIGPVTALEILTEFSDLEDFKDWWSQVQMGVSIPDDVHSKFRKKFKKNAAKLFLPPAFPDRRVDAAYLEPEVDSDPSAFQWGVPDLEALRHFLMTAVGWSPERTDEVLVPVIRDVNRRELEGTQANITQFFEGSQGAGAFAPQRRTGGQSRMEKAFTRLRDETAAKRKADDAGSTSVPTIEIEDPERHAPEPSRKRQNKGRAPMVHDNELGQGTEKSRKKKRKATNAS